MSACFHCGEPVTGGGRFCCAGCEAVARTIADAGLGAYYQTRTAPAPRPQALPEIRAPSGLTETALVLERVRCAACLWLIEQVLRRHPGVTQAVVSYATRRAHVAWDPARTTLGALIGAIRAVGYDAAPYDARARDGRERDERRAALWRLFVAAFGAMQVMMYAFPAYVDEVGAQASQLMRWASLLITTPVLLFSCGPFFAGAWRELRHARPGLDTPIALGLGFGFLASAWATLTGRGEVYFDSISMLAFLLLAARFLQAEAERRAAHALDPLLRIGQGRAPSAGETIRLAPGERVPADGVVVEGASTADESLLTGESRPVAKRAGDELVGGSVNLEQPITMRVTRSGADTRAAAIARLAERGAAFRPRLVEAAEAVARRLTWVVLLATLAAGIYWQDPWVAIAVLVVACPCALALAAPVVLTRASAALLGHGILLTRASALEALARLTDVVLDKTGTLTFGQLSVARIFPLGDAGQQECYELAAALEASSRHPVARAFSGDNRRATAPRNVTGQGIEATVDGQRMRIGTEAFCRGLCGAPPPGPAHRNFDSSFVFLAGERGWLAAFELADRLRPEAAALVAELKAHGLQVHLASGDRPEVGAALARTLWIESCSGGMTPRNKYRYVADLQRQGRVVAMVGDGLNDTPVLARADVSFAMGGGADAAQLRADFVLLGTSLQGIIFSMNIAARAMRLVRQNIGWALAYNAVALPLAAAGWIGPWEAALAMGASSLTVLLNALRTLEPQWKASTSSSPSPSPSYS